MIKSRVSRGRQYGELVVKVELRGVDAVMRWAIHQLHGQVEFCEMGAKTLRGLRRQLGPKNFDSYLKRLVGDGDQFKLYRGYSL